MNTEVSIIEPETLQYLPAKTLLRLVETSQKVKKHSALFHMTVKELPDMFRRLEELDVEPDFDLRSGDININFAGDGPKLAEVWKVLRRAGYQTNSHPKKGDTSFYSFWNREGSAQIWMNFSSSVCRRVQVGTEMVEQPIYETQCGELPALDVGEPSVPAVVEDNDIPF